MRFIDPDSRPGRGRVEVLSRSKDQPNSEWGTICNNHFDHNDAKVICRYMGFSSGEAINSGYEIAGEGPIWIDNLNCSGEEGNINECSFLMTHNCDHTQDAGVLCGR